MRTQEDAFYQIWTRKEAFVKAIGEGLSYPLDRFSVAFHMDKPVRMIHISNSTIEANKWLLNSFDMRRNGQNYKIACIVKNTNCHVTQYEFSATQEIIQLNKF